MATINCEVPDNSRITTILQDKLHADYLFAFVELGENWELIASIFYQVGFEEAMLQMKEFLGVEDKG